MLYQLFKIPARLAIKLYCKHIYINRKDVLSLDGPLLIACNHPNSFLDAVILATLFDKPVVSLARGDAFNNKFVFNVLRGLNILPVYRLSEGTENLHTNYSTFDTCRDIFRKNGIVLIFSEGLCVNEWKLRPLKKGTARLAISSWEQDIPLTILPAGINYHSFSSFGKIVQLHFGQPILPSDFPEQTSDGQTNRLFNQKLSDSLMPLIVHLDKDDKEKRKMVFGTSSAITGNMLLAIPAMMGKILHAPLYLPVRFFARKTFLHSGHYDSIVTGLLFLGYPFYLTLIWISLLFVLNTIPATAIVLCLPLLAYIYLHWKRPDFTKK